MTTFVITDGKNYYSEFARCFGPYKEATGYTPEKLPDILAVNDGNNKAKYYVEKRHIVDTTFYYKDERAEIAPDPVAWTEHA